jgi:uncharacterized protein YutE (UPF0331/DUF86 family)
MPLVPHIVRHDLHRLAEALARLERVSSGLSLEEYRADEVRRAACERFLEQAIQASVHINEHDARREWGVEPANAHEGFRLWGEHGVMPAEFAAEVSRAAGLRNRLAHAYDTIDDEVLFRAIPAAFAQLRQHGAYVLAYVNTIDPIEEAPMPEGNAQA